MIKRESCVICQSSLKHLTTFYDFPIYMGIWDRHEEQKYVDMEWSSCTECGCVQLGNLVELDVLYRIPHNPAIGKTWERHNRALVQIIQSDNPKSLLDIGGANLKIANILCRNKNVNQYDIIDFSSEKYGVKKVDEKINLINGSIEDYASPNKVDSVVMSHTFEHFYEPVEVLKNIRKFIHNKSKIYISVPYIENQLKELFLNAMMFEHTFYINDHYIELCCRNAGFSVEKIESFSEYNSIYVLAPIENEEYFRMEFDKNYAKEVFLEFIKNVRNDTKNINKKIKNKKIYVFGGHVFTQYLLNFGLCQKNIKCILDNDPDKQNYLLYGTDLEIKSPEIISTEEDPIVLLRVAQYKQEIEQQLRRMNPQCIII